LAEPPDAPAPIAVRQVGYVTGYERRAERPLSGAQHAGPAGPASAREAASGRGDGKAQTSLKMALSQPADARIHKELVELSKGLHKAMLPVPTLLHNKLEQGPTRR
jgi:hypothetical protein